MEDVFIECVTDAQRGSPLRLCAGRLSPSQQRSVTFPRSAESGGFADRRGPLSDRLPLSLSPL